MYNYVNEEKLLQKLGSDKLLPGGAACERGWLIVVWERGAI